MKAKQIIPIKKRSSGGTNEPYVKFGPKMLYISSRAMEMFGEAGYIRMSISVVARRLIITKAEKAEDTFRLSRVNETKAARRIETNRALLSILKAGFPLYMVDRRLPVEILLDGSLAADFSLPIPLQADSAS